MKWWVKSIVFLVLGVGLTCQSCSQPISGVITISPTFPSQTSSAIVTSTPYQTTSTSTLSKQNTPTKPAFGNPTQQELFPIDFDAVQTLPIGYYILTLMDDESTHAISYDGSIDVKISDYQVQNVTYDGKILLYLNRKGGGIIHLDTRQKQTLPADLRFPIIVEVAPSLKWVVSFSPIPDHKFAVQSLEDNSREYDLSSLLGFETAEYDYPRWSPDSKWLAINRGAVSGRKGRQPEKDGLYLLDAACLENPQTCKSALSGPYQLTEDRINFDFLYSWSPDSQQIVVESKLNEQFLSFDITTKQFTEIISNLNNFTPVAWMPDNRYLAFEENSDIRIISSKGGNSSLIKVAGGQVIGVLSTYPPPIFKAGETLIISGAGTNLRLRSTAGIGGSVLKYLKSGDKVMLLEGPVFIDNTNWWKVKLPESDLMDIA